MGEAASTISSVGTRSSRPPAHCVRSGPTTAPLCLINEGVGDNDRVQPVKPLTAGGTIEAYTGPTSGAPPLKGEHDEPGARRAQADPPHLCAGRRDHWPGA